LVCAIHFAQWAEFAAGWNGVAFRFLFVAEDDRLFAASLKTHGPSPLASERYVQERSLFSFIVSGFSVLECFCYSLCAAASVPYPKTFRMADRKYQRDVKPETTLHELQAEVPNDAITSALNEIVDSTE